jgi:hypothetical protein
VESDRQSAWLTTGAVRQPIICVTELGLVRLPFDLAATMLASMPARPSPMRSFTDFPTPTPTPMAEGPPPRFPHVRAALNSLARQHKPLDPDDAAAAGDDDAASPRVSADTLAAAVGLLEDEDEDGLQALLRATFGLAPDEVGPRSRPASCCWR